MKTLTQKQQDVLQFITDFIRENKYAPTVRQIAANFDLSVRAAYDHITALKKKGQIKSTKGSCRTMEIIAEKKESIGAIVNIPILGEVAAGTGVLSEENVSEFIPVHNSVLKKNKTYFAVKVCGDSMTGIGVMDGDTAVIEQRQTAENGDVVVAMINEGYVLKKFFKQNLNIKLCSENSKYHPIYTNQIRILGKLAFVFRTY
ncbi:MAG: transcriptional repressor LexA [Spirochaetaceae bacterium]|jgi:repressor LexA|nr:transcriptional repressor LexA [Spirochaetaceae bacterium]